MQLVPSPPLRGPKRYEITIHVPVWTALEILLGTHLREPSGRLGLRILDHAGQELRRSEVDLATLLDCTFVRFVFAPIESLETQSYTVELELTQAKPETVVSVFEVLEAKGRSRLHARVDGRLGLPTAATRREAGSAAEAPQEPLPRLLADPRDEPLAGMAPLDAAAWARATAGRDVLRIALGLGPTVGVADDPHALRLHVMAHPHAIRAEVAACAARGGIVLLHAERLGLCEEARTTAALARLSGGVALVAGHVTDRHGETVAGGESGPASTMLCAIGAARLLETIDAPVAGPRGFALLGAWLEADARARGLGVVRDPAWRARAEGSFLRLVSAEERLALARRERGAPPPREAYRTWAEWRDAARVARGREHLVTSRESLFSLTTTVYDTAPEYLHELARTVAEQDFPFFEWLVLDNGSRSAATREGLAAIAKRDARVRLFRVEDNLHIIGGNRWLLERARCEYVVPIDSDDLIAPDALRVLAAHALAHGRPAVLYSDEEKVDAEGRPGVPMLRHGKAPLVGLSHCYFAHLSCFRRDLALRYGAYSEDYARGSHDWDTHFRISEHDDRVVHVPEVLYSWRMAPTSTSATLGAKDYIAQSQRSVVTSTLARRALQGRFDVRSDPRRPGIGYWECVRKQVEPVRVEVVLHLHGDRAAAERAHKALPGWLARTEYPSEHLRVRVLDRVGLRSPDAVDRCGIEEHVAVNEALAGSSAELVVVVDQDVAPLGPRWVWDVLGAFELDPGLVAASGLVLDADGKIRAMPRVGGLDGHAAMPFLGNAFQEVNGPTQRYDLELNCLAVAMPFVALRRRGVLELGGFRMPFSGRDPGDLELCLRAVAAGKTVGFLGKVRFRCQTREPDYGPDPRDPRLAAIFAAHHDLIRDDPYHHPVCSLESDSFGEIRSGAQRHETLRAAIWIPPDELLTEAEPTARYDRAMRRAPRAALREAAAARGWPFRFSILTCAFDTEPAILRETARSVLRQTWLDLEWVLLDNGSTDAATRALLAELAQEPRVRLLRAEPGLGIIGGLRHCLLHASGEYAVPLDHDDVLTPDALGSLGDAILRGGRPGLVYSDEAILDGTTVVATYRRPDWDPVLNLASSYVFHLVAFARARALELGTFGSPDANWCQDWDTMFRFAGGGERIVHVPRVLHHWRRHARSQTNRDAPDPGSLRSQRAILERQVAARADKDRFTVVPCPIDRGAPELHVQRVRTAPAPLDVVVLGGARETPKALLDAARYPFRSVRTQAPDAPASAFAPSADGLVCCVAAGLEPAGGEWAWEALGLFDWHADVDAVAARLLTKDRRVLSGPDRLDETGAASCPWAGRPATDPGPWALALKPQCTQALHGAFWIARATALHAALAELPRSAPASALATALARSIRARGRRIAFTPFVAAVLARAT